MKKTVCDENKCMGCQACIEKCPVGAISIIDNLMSYNAVINPSCCIECGLCTKVCSNVTPLRMQEPKVWYQGWSNDQNIRLCSASGGVASSIMRAFVKTKGYVCSCTYKDGEFEFIMAESEEEIARFSGSKYVKSNPHLAYKAIKQKILKENNVLFVGLPCQVAGVKQFLGEKLSKNLYTIDLICHGTPSPKLLSKYLQEHSLEIHDLENIKFRIKQGDPTSNYFTRIEEAGIIDKYSYSFLKSINYTENCYSCQFAKTERVSDLTLGDSWGSALPDKEKEKGISLMLCQSAKGKELLNIADIYTVDVDVQNAIKNNRQLTGPANITNSRSKFFGMIKAGKTYDQAVIRCYPKVFLKQEIKRYLFKLKLKENKKSKTEYQIQYYLKNN